MTIYGREVELEPLAPGEVVEEVVVVAKTRSTQHQEGVTVASVGNDPDTGEPPRMSSELKYLMDLGASPDLIAKRAKLAGPHSVLRAIRKDDDTPK
ncbi:hypothetical protein RH857_12480 [Nesterenkonia flava]|uniref:Uncharacterized protein n=1 Tax=Nesterenkonia flava TaxID=469799 RepID=A0ABU1FW85_9MICC|nr:hypothetical protein [Nesterenkonia flava]